MDVNRLHIWSLAILVSALAVLAPSRGTAQTSTWRACYALICQGNECEGPRSRAIVVTPADLADTGFSEGGPLDRQLERLAARTYPAAQGYSNISVCERASSREAAMSLARAEIDRARARGAGEVKIADAYEVFAYRHP